MITVLMQIKREMELQLQLGVSLPKAELYLISKLPNTNVNSNSHHPDIHISIHWGQTANIMKRVLTKQETFRLLTLRK